MSRPADRAVVVQVAREGVPLTWVRDAARRSAWEPRLNVTVSPSAGATVAVKVTFWPKVLGFGDEVTAMTGVGRDTLITDTVPFPALVTEAVPAPGASSITDTLPARLTT